MGRLRDEAIDVHKKAKYGDPTNKYNVQNNVWDWLTQGVQNDGGTPEWIDKIRTNPEQPRPAFDCLTQADFCDAEVLFITDARTWHPSHEKARPWMRKYFPPDRGVTLSVYLIGEKETKDKMKPSDIVTVREYEKLAEEHGGKLLLTRIEKNQLQLCSRTSSDSGACFSDSS